MTRRPLFSTYRQGENRVTGSMIAVFERLDLATLQAILGDASGDVDLELVRFELQPTSASAPTVPDGRISASFDYLFESKTAYDAIKKPNQITSHLGHFSARPGVDERLFVITPDSEAPAVLAEIADHRVRWFNFKTLDAALGRALADETVPDDERFLIRELRALLVEDGLLGRQDTVIVAAGFAFPYYERTGAYVCQAGRAFRPDLRHLGFYRAKQIERIVAVIQHREDNVVFSHREADARRSSSAPEQHRIADLIEQSLAAGTHVDGVPHQVFLLSRTGEPDTVELAAPISHASPGAWTMGQRYAFLEELQVAQTTEDLS